MCEVSAFWTSASMGSSVLTVISVPLGIAERCATIATVGAKRESRSTAKSFLMVGLVWD
jgi:hypothetical protein